MFPPDVPPWETAVVETEWQEPQATSWQLHPAGAVPPDPRAAYLAQRMRQTHDIWHVLTGYATDVAGEVQLQAFTLADELTAHVNVAGARTHRGPMQGRPTMRSGRP